MLRRAALNSETRTPSFAPTRWALWSAPRSAWAFLLSAEVTALVLTAVLLVHEPFTAATAVRFALLATLSIGYSEVAVRSVRMQRYLGSDKIFANPMSVWSYAAVLTIPAGWAAAFIATQYGHALWQRRRDASGKPFRVLFTAAATMLAQLAVAVLVDADGRHALHGQVLAQLAALLGVALFLAVNLLVLLTGMWLAMRPPSVRALIPDADTLGHELGTLILGMVAAEVVLHSPVLTPALLVLVALLHRGNVVKSLRKLARTDSKTGLLTVAAWREAAGIALKRAERSGAGLAVLLIDLDHFKAINDSHGHLLGDQVLTAVAACVRDEVRGHDSAGRFGGEELVVTLEDVDAHAAVAVAERLRTAIRHLTFDVDLRVTASIGLAHTGTPRAATSIDALLEQADIALYHAKDAGRDRVEAAGPAA